MISSLVLVIVAELFAEIPGCDANNGIGVRIECGLLSPKRFDGHRSFPNLLSFTVKILVANERQEPDKVQRSADGRVIKNALQFLFRFQKSRRKRRSFVT